MYPSIWQILLVLVIVLLIFGPKRIPGIGKSLGEAIRNFRNSLTDAKKESDSDNKKS